MNNRASDHAMLLAVNYRQLIRWLFRIAGILIICHLLNRVAGTPSWQLERLFELGLEANIPTWFSSVLWAIAAVAAFGCSQLVILKSDKNLWSLIALGLLTLSIDEVAQIHENIFRIINLFFPKAIQQQIISNFRATAWPIIASPFLVAVIIWLVVTLRRLLKGSSQAGLLLSLGFFTVVFGGWGLEITTNFLNHGVLEWVWSIENIFEESLEMIGAIVIISGLFAHQHVLADKLRNRDLETPEINEKSKKERLVECRV